MFLNKYEMRTKRPRQIVAAALLAYASILTYHCPCPTIISCHKPHFFLSVGSAVGLILTQ